MVKRSEADEAVLILREMTARPKSLFDAKWVGTMSCSCLYCQSSEPEHHAKSCPVMRAWLLFDRMETKR